MDFLAAQESVSGNSDENIWIASSDGDVARVQQLVGEGVSINAQDAHGYSPMHAAVSYGQVELVELLISMGALVDIEDADGDTPLLYCEEPEVFELLLKHGADQTKRNHEGEGIFEKIIEDENEIMMKYLIEKGMVEDPVLLAKMLRSIEVGTAEGQEMETVEEEEEEDEEDAEVEVEGLKSEK